MRTSQHFRGALEMAMVAVFCVSAIRAEESAGIPVAEPVPAADPDKTDGGSPVAEPVSTVEPDPGIESTPVSEMVLPAEGILMTGKEPAPVNPAEADQNEDGELTLRELALQDHRAQLEIYDLNNDKKISEKEWKAANEENVERAEKFFLLDKDEDGNIDENEAVGFLMERISLSSTYIDASGDENVDILEYDTREAAPSELRVTLFSIPLGD